jgi:hypothetical protein
VGVVPPFVGVAVNVTLVPEQTLLELAAIETLAGAAAFTVVVISLELAGLPVTHGRLEVILTLTTFPFISVEDE